MYGNRSPIGSKSLKSSKRSILKKSRSKSKSEKHMRSAGQYNEMELKQGEDSMFGISYPKYGADQNKLSTGNYQ